MTKDSVSDQVQIENSFSSERLLRYVMWGGGETQAALDLYALNTRLSEVLYTPLQTLEVVLRNHIHIVMTESYGTDWMQDANVVQIENQRKQVDQALEELHSERKIITPGRLVAAVTFSFWTAMFSPAYEALWQQTLHKIARRADGRGLRRKDFSGALTRIRLLRNRIAHHEPILHWDLPKHYGNMLQITGWLSPAAEDWCVSQSRFLEVYPPLGIRLVDAKGLTPSN